MMSTNDQGTAEGREPLVGIFWMITDRGAPSLLIHAVPLAQAEQYGEFRTFGGHYEYWDALSRSIPPTLAERGLPSAPQWSEYEEWPRGRVVFHEPSQRFILYADRKLQKPDHLVRIASEFRLSAESFDVRSDHHYVSSRHI